MIYRLFPFPVRLDYLETTCGLLLALGLLVLWRIRPEWIEAGAVTIRRIARRRVLCIALAAALGPGLRLAMLPIAPPPAPGGHDEFGHLLVADTLLHGRLANPPLPFPDAFASIYILQKPSYASIYPIGNGAFLALGWKLFGHPWFGVWLAMVLCCGSVAWMAYQWLSPTAACATGMLCSLSLGSGSTWMNSYWGGAVAAAGGALALGALPRLRRTGAWQSAAILGAGWSLVWFVRPFESLIFGAILASALLGSWRRVRGAVPVLALFVAADGAMFLRHNYRVTGDSLTSPYTYSRAQLGAPLPLVWQKLAPEPAGLSPRQHQNYLWILGLYGESKQTRMLYLRRAKDFFLGIPMTLSFLVGALAWRSRKVRFLLLVIAVCVAWSELYAVIFPHYLAAITGALLAIAGRGLVQLSLLRIAGAPAGACLAVGLWSAAAAVALRPAHPWVAFGHPAPIGARNEALRNLEAQRGGHIVFVRYTPDYNTHDEWVYNRAELSDAKVVWVNDLGRERNAEVRNYFADRTAWIVEPAGDKQLKPYN